MLKKSILTLSLLCTAYHIQAMESGSNIMTLTRLAAAQTATNDQLNMLTKELQKTLSELKNEQSKREGIKQMLADVLKQLGSTEFPATAYGIYGKIVMKISKLRNAQILADAQDPQHSSSQADVVATSIRGEQQKQKQLNQDLNALRCSLQELQQKYANQSNELNDRETAIAELEETIVELSEQLTTNAEVSQQAQESLKQQMQQLRSQIEKLKQLIQDDEDSDND